MAVDYRAEARKAAARYGIPVDPFLAQLQQESGFQPGGITSSAGAKWIGQFIPSTARAYGVHDDLSSIYGAAHYMADNLKRYGTLPRALSAYNSGRPDAYLDPNFAHGQTFNYVRSILGSHPAAAGGAPATPPVASAPTAPAAAGLPADIQRILNANNKLLGLPSVNYGKPIAAIAPPRPRAVKRGEASPPVNVWVNLPHGADRPGHPTNAPVLKFVAKIAHAYGEPLTIGTGTNHNQFVVGTHRQSDHWEGNAADIPSSGAALTRLGQDALIQAGMKPAQARKQHGGVFNVGRYQILFNTNVGGNHYNHLHVGVR